MRFALVGQRDTGHQGICTRRCQEHQEIITVYSLVGAIGPAQRIKHVQNYRPIGTIRRAWSNIIG